MYVATKEIENQKTQHTAQKRESRKRKHKSMTTNTIKNQNNQHTAQERESVNRKRSSMTAQEFED